MSYITEIFILDCLYNVKHNDKLGHSNIYIQSVK